MMDRKVFMAFLKSGEAAKRFDVAAAAKYAETARLFGLPIVWANAGKKVQK
jgi:hypothetical protein